jgi:hypothetical protein
VSAWLAVHDEVAALLPAVSSEQIAAAVRHFQRPRAALVDPANGANCYLIATWEQLQNDKPAPERVFQAIGAPGFKKASQGALRQTTAVRRKGTRGSLARVGRTSSA